MGEAFGKFLHCSVCGLFQVLLLFQFAKDAAGFLLQVGRATEQRTAFAHVHSAVQARPFVEGFVGVAVKRFEVILVEAGGGFEFGDEASVGLLQQRCLYFVQQVRCFNSQAVPGNVRARQVDAHFLRTDTWTRCCSIRACACFLTASD